MVSLNELIIMAHYPVTAKPDAAYFSAVVTAAQGYQ